MGIPNLSGKEAVIMSLLVEAGKSYGLQLVQRSDGRLKRGTVYVTLNRLEEKGFISSWLEPPASGQHGPPRRLYSVTGEGARILSIYSLYANGLKTANIDFRGA